MDDPAWSAIHRLASVVEKMQKVDGLFDSTDTKWRDPEDKTPRKIELHVINGPSLAEKEAVIAELKANIRVMEGDIAIWHTRYNNKGLLPNAPK